MVTPVGHKPTWTLRGNHWGRRYMSGGARLPQSAVACSVLLLKQLFLLYTSDRRSHTANLSAGTYSADSVIPGSSKNNTFSGTILKS